MGGIFSDGKGGLGRDRVDVGGSKAIIFVFINVVIFLLRCAYSSAKLYS